MKLVSRACLIMPSRKLPGQLKEVHRIGARFDGYNQRTSTAPEFSSRRPRNDGMVHEFYWQKASTKPASALNTSEADTFHRSSQAILEEAFRKAKEIFTDEASLDESSRRLLENGTSMQDVHRSLLQAQDVYVSNPQCKARKWLVALSERITYYGQIFDVLVQHHPEYVSLAWGAFKLVFIVSLAWGP